MKHLANLWIASVIVATAISSAAADDPKIIRSRPARSLPPSSGRVIVLGKDGTIQQVDLSTGLGAITVQEGLFAPRAVYRPTIRQGFVFVANDNEWMTMEKSLKDDGFTAEQLKKVKAAFDSAKKSSARPMEYRLTDSIKGFDKTRGLTVRSAPDHRFMVGVATAEIEPELRKELGLKDDEGVLVSSVLENMPAKNGGVLAKDVITAVDGKKIGKIEELVAAVQAAGKAKKAVELTISRDGKIKKISLTPIERTPVALLENALKPSGGVWRHLQVYPKQNVGSLVGPGIITRSTSGNAKIEKQLQEVNDKLDRLQKAVEALAKGKSKKKS